MPATKAGAGTRHDAVQLAATQKVGINLILARLIQPGFLTDDLGIGLAKIHDARLAEAGVSLDALVHAAPQVQALHCQQDLTHVASHGVAPAPVATGLLSADASLLAQHDGVPLFR